MNALVDKLKADKVRVTSETTKLGTENDAQKKRLDCLASEAVKFRTAGEAIDDYRSQVAKLEQEKSSEWR